MVSSVLKTEKLCKSFSNGGVQQHVIKNLDLEIMEGDFTIIMGSSGSGKSTLLYALSGMDKPSMGKVFFGDKEIQDYSNDQLAVFRRGNCGFVFQSVYLLENQTVLDIFSDVHKNGQSIVMVTHDIKTALRGTRVLYLRDGGVVGDYKMPIYGQDDLKERRSGLTSFLDGMGW